MLLSGLSASRWVRCNTERIHPKVEYLVTELLQGCEYEFRVSAENIVGAGDPSPPSKPVFAKDPIGEFPVLQKHCVSRLPPNPTHNKDSLLPDSETQSTGELPGHRLLQGVGESVLAAAHRHRQREDLRVPAGVPEGWRGGVVQGEALEVQIPVNVLPRGFTPLVW